MTLNPSKVNLMGKIIYLASALYQLLAFNSIAEWRKAKNFTLRKTTKHWKHDCQCCNLKGNNLK